MRSLLLALLLLGACAYVVPRSWRAFHAEPDQAEAAIRKTLAELDMQITAQGPARLETGWSYGGVGVRRTRERYVIEWEREASDGTLVVYVRHELQEEAGELGDPGKYSATEHTGGREDEMLNRISARLCGP